MRRLPSQPAPAVRTLGGVAGGYRGHILENWVKGTDAGRGVGTRGPAADRKPPAVHRERGREAARTPPPPGPLSLRSWNTSEAEVACPGPALPQPCIWVPFPVPVPPALGTVGPCGGGHRCYSRNEGLTLGVACPRTCCTPVIGASVEALAKHQAVTPAASHLGKAS